MVKFGTHLKIILKYNYNSFLSKNRLNNNEKTFNVHNQLKTEKLYNVFST